MELDRFDFESIESTNKWAKANLGKFRPDHFTVVSAKGQTGGYGRRGRKWQSPVGKNLYLSICFRQTGRLDSLTEVVAIGIAQALEDLGLKPDLKWPNDVLLRGKKISGVLCEASSGWAIIGIGLNVNMTAEELKQIDKPATSVLVETSQPQNLHQIGELVEGAVLANIGTFLRQGFKPFYKLYTERLVHKLGDPIQFDDGKHVWQGTFHKINADGSLSLIVEPNISRAFYTGDIA